MKKINCILLSVIFIIVLSPIIVANTITIHNTVETQKREVRLGDIAQLKGEEEFVKQVENIILGQTPLPGYQSNFYRNNLVSLLADNGVDVNQIRFNVPYQFSVRGDYKVLSADKLLEMGKEYIYQNLDYDQSQIEIDLTSQPDDLMRPYGELLIKPGNISSRSLLGRTTIPVEVYIDDELYRRIHIQYNVGLWKEVLVSKDNLSRGTNLQREKFETEDKLLTSSNTSYVTADMPLEEYELRTSIRSGRALEERMIVLPDLVERWSDVKLIAQVGEIKIITKAKARESGQLGDIIIVENKQSGKRIEARVVGPGEVEALIN